MLAEISCLRGCRISFIIGFLSIAYFFFIVIKSVGEKKKNCPKKKKKCIENPKFFLSLIIKGVAYIIIVGILSYNYSLIHIVSLILVSFLFLPCFSCSCFLDLNTSWDKTRLHCLD